MRRTFFDETLTLTERHYVYINLIKLFSSSEDQNQLIIALDVESLVQVSELSHNSWVLFLDQFNPVHNVSLLLKVSCIQ